MSQHFSKNCKEKLPMGFLKAFDLQLTANQLIGTNDCVEEQINCCN